MDWLIFTMFSLRTHFHLRLFEYFGCCPIHQRDINKKIQIKLAIIFAVHFLLCIFFLIDSFFVFHIVHRSEIAIISGFVKICCAFVANVTSLVESLLRWKKQKEFWKNYFILRSLRDGSLRPINFKRKFFIETIFLLTLILSTQSICFTKLYEYGYSFGFFIIFYYVLSLYMLVVLTVHTRFYLLLVHLVHQELDCLEMSIIEPTATTREYLTQRFFGICSLTFCINEIFSWSLGIAVVRFIAVLTTDINFFYTALSDNENFTVDGKHVHSFKWKIFLICFCLNKTTHCFGFWINIFQFFYFVCCRSLHLSLICLRRHQTSKRK